jgi:hypothetical protein
VSEPPLVKVAFVDEQGGVESLWAFDLGHGRYKLDNTPWFQYGVSYQDVVAASVRNEGLFFDEVLEKSGYRTLRVRSDEDVPKSLLETLVGLGCKYEGARPSFIAIDVPAEVELSAATNVLKASGLDWEYGDPTYEQVTGAGV